MSSNTKTVNVLKGYITIEFHPKRVLRHDLEGTKIIRAIADAVSESIGLSVNSQIITDYAYALAYTVNLTVHRSLVDDETNVEYSDPIEAWYKKVTGGDDPVETFMYWYNNIPNVFANAYSDAMETVHKLPKLLSEQLTEDNTDPKLPSGKENTEQK